MKLILSDALDRRTRKIKIDGINTGDVYVTNSPVGNCQTFSIALIYKLFILTKEQFKLLLCELYKDIGRKQLLSDVRECDSPKLLELFTPFSTNIITAPYISTNGSHMVMHLIQLDTSKFME